jgi:hypothetical protein
MFAREFGIVFLYEFSDGGLVRVQDLIKGNSPARRNLSLRIPIITFELPLRHEAFNSDRLSEKYGVALLSSVACPQKIN